MAYEFSLAHQGAVGHILEMVTLEDPCYRERICAPKDAMINWNCTFPEMLPMMDIVRGDRWDQVQSTGERNGSPFLYSAQKAKCCSQPGQCQHDTGR